MLEDVKSEYHYGSEADLYTFYRLPKALFSIERYKRLSDGAKLLYGLMLDRMGLSIKNGWLDKEKRVYIFFTLEDAQEFLGCGLNKAVKLFAELKEVELIQQQKQGMGRPAIIYVMKFITESKVESASEVEAESDSKSHDFSKAKVLTFENQKSRLLKSKGDDLSKTKCNNTDLNNTEKNETESSDTDSINPSVSPFGDEMEGLDFDQDWFYERIEYDRLREECKDQERLDELVSLLADVLQSKKPTQWVNGEARPIKAVQGQLMKVGPEHILYVLDCMAESTVSVKNMRSYLLTALYNAPLTAGHSVANRMQHDLYGLGSEAGDG